MHARIILSRRGRPLFGGLVGLVLWASARGQEPVPAAPPQGAEAAAIELDAVSVQGEAVRGSASDLRRARQAADVAIDAISFDQIARYSAGDAAEAIIRIPGVSVANGQFAVVRGLSDRYLSTTLEGLKVPSPDPEKQAVQFDLLPASIIGSLVVAKTYSADLWAESAGGNIDVLSQPFPEERVLQAGFGVKFNLAASDRDGVSSDARVNFAERLGFGARNRPAPGPLRAGAGFVPVADGGHAPGYKASFDFGQSFSFGDVRRLGVMASILNENGTRQRVGRWQAFFVARGSAPTAAVTRPRPRPATPGTPSGFEDPALPLARGILFEAAESESEAVFAGTLAVAFRISPEHELKFNGLFIQSGIDTAQINQNVLGVDAAGAAVTVDGYAGFGGAEDHQWFKTVEVYRERNLSLGQLSGRHAFPDLLNLRARWAAQSAVTVQKESPFAEALYGTPLSAPGTSFVLLGSNDVPDPLTVVWSDNRETQNAGRLDLELGRALWTKEESTLKFGGAFERSDREVTGAAHFYGNPSATLTGATPAAVFDALVTERSGPPFETASAARREIRAGYASLTWFVWSKLRLIGGARYEDYALGVGGAGQWGNFTSGAFYDDSAGSGGFGAILGTTAAGAPAFESQAWYPGYGLVFTPTKRLTFRAGYSETSGRPSMREVSPFFNKSLETGNLVIGNPALRPSAVRSLDARVEYVVGRTTTLAASVFRKDISDPIEKLLFNTTAQTSELTESWLNNPTTARLDGFELEFRQSLGAFSAALEAFSLSGNFTHLKAEVAEHPIVVQRSTSSFQDPTRIPALRRLYDQPDYIANLDLTWSDRRLGTTVTLAAYAIGDVLKTAGLSAFSYDLYERRYARYDLIVSQRLSARLKLKASVKNLSDPVRGTVYDPASPAAGLERATFRAGRDVSVSITAEF